MRRTNLTIEDVVESQLCTGCGACASVEPGRYKMGDTLEYCRRPFLRDNAAATSGEAISICPGAHLEHNFDKSDKKLIKELLAGWGPVYEVWEGYACDEEIRLSGSSGGVATALALFCLEKNKVDKVLHTAVKQEQPYLNKSVFSKSRGELLAATGSRYAPSSPCDGLHQIDNEDDSCLLIGKPCDIAAVQSVRKIRSKINENVKLTLAFFCAGTPSLNATFELLKANGIENPDQVSKLKYRGDGWPGLWTAEYKDSMGGSNTKQMTYKDSWGFLQKYRQWRCYICPDHTGEFADIAVGDPWYREIGKGDPGRSIIIVRTKTGQKYLHEAVEAGYIKLEKNDSTLLPKSQPYMLHVRGALWARLKMLQLFGAGVPEYKGFDTFTFWLHNLTAKEKFQSFAGTIKRIFSKRLRERIVPVEWTPDTKTKSR